MWIVWLLLAVLALPATADRNSTPEAEAQLAQGDAAQMKGDYEGALTCYIRARDLDPTWVRAWAGMALSTYRSRGGVAALPLYQKVVDLDPGNPMWRQLRSQVYVALDLYQEAIDDLQGVIKEFGESPQLNVLLGMALVAAGEIDEGLALHARGFEAAGKPVGFRLRMRAYDRMADWALVEEESAAALSTGTTVSAIFLYEMKGLVEQGKFAEAEKLLVAVDALPPSNVQGACRAYLLGTPAIGKAYDPEAAIRAAKGVVARTTDSSEINVLARTLFLAGRSGECLDLLATKGRRVNFDTLFWLGAAQWKQERLAEARDTFADAWRRNPYLLRHAPRVEGLEPFLAWVIEGVKAEKDAGQDDRAQRQHELATHLLTVAEIEGLVRGYRFSRALDEYGRLLPLLGSPVRKAEIEARLPEIRGMSGALDKLVAAINEGRLKLETKLAGLVLTLVKADDLRFDFTITKGEGKFLWASLGAPVFSEFTGQSALAPEERFGLACLSWDSGQIALATRQFEEAAKPRPDLRPSIDAFVARRRGTAIPEGGFLLFRGCYVSGDEKAHLEKGLVRYRGEWVTGEVKEKRSRGLILVSGKWVPDQEAELTRRGYLKYKGKWMDREENDGIRSGWADAYVEETAHYRIVTNTNDAFAKDLALLIETAYPEYVKYYDGQEPKLPGKEKMTLYAFRTYEDYRKHCVEHKAEAQLAAAGYAASDSNVVVGWDKTGNRRQFLQTMAHEAAHLFYFRIAPKARPPSWYAEAMATYFEGFSWDGKAFQFDFLADGRLPYVRDAIKAGKQIRLADLLRGEALDLINQDTTKALLFYAECWSLNFFLSHTTDTAWRGAYAQ